MSAVRATWPDEVSALKAWLEDEGYPVVWESAPDVVGNHSCEYAIGPVHLRVNWDRGVPEISLGAWLISGWYDLAIWQAWLEGAATTQDGLGFSDQVRFLREHLGRVCERVAQDPEVNRTLTELRWARTRLELQLPADTPNPRWHESPAPAEIADSLVAAGQA